METPTLTDASSGAEETEFSATNTVGVTTNALLHSQATPWTINAGASIAAMSPDPTYSQIVVAGRDVLKIYRTDTLAEVVNIRSGRVNMLYSSNDVKWNPNESHKHWIATAATNGHVVIWNLMMKGKKLEHPYPDHTRTVNRICWQPREPNNLLSGSQDGLMKLWDMRDRSSATTFDAQSEVRDVQFSPFYPYYFASALENGNILVWDMRKQQAERRITAHNGLIGALAWHPVEKNTLASGGRDRLIKTWDLTAGSKPSSITQTIAFVGRLTWRPSSHGRPWHIASSAGSSDNAVHIWDTKYPFVPLGSLQGARDVSTAHFWTESNHIVSSSKDGCVRFFDLSKHCYLPNRHMTATSIRFNVRGQLARVHEPFDRRVNLVALDAPKPDTIATFASGPGFVAIDSLLTSKAQFRNYEAPTIRLFDGTTPPITDLGALLPSKHYPSSIGSQTSTLTDVPKRQLDDRFGFDPELFKFLAIHYKYHGATVVELLEHNAQVAAQAHQAQLAQMWNMLAMVFTPVADFMGSYGALLPSVGVAGGLASAVTPATKLRFGETMQGGDKILENGMRVLDDRQHDPSHPINIEVSGIPTLSLANSGAQSPRGGGTKSADMFSPNPDDWDLHLLDVPSAQHGQHGVVGYGHASYQPGTTLGYGQGANRGLSLDFGAFDSQTGFTEHDFVEDFDHPRHLMAPILDDDDMPSNGMMLMNEVGMGDSAGESVGLFGAFGAGFAAIQAASALENQREYDATEVILEILNYYEQEGDVQTCVFVGLVLQDVVALEPRRMLAWMIGYVDLLHRLQLWNCANSLAKHCHLDSIRNMSKQGTTFYTKCASCSKAILSNSGVYCENCKKPTSNCAVCRLPVKGSLVWCPGCGHGGHSQHLQKWFQTESACPTGCGHICLLSSPIPPSPGPPPSPSKF